MVLNYVFLKVVLNLGGQGNSSNNRVFNTRIFSQCLCTKMAFQGQNWYSTVTLPTLQVLESVHLANNIYYSSFSAFYFLWEWITWVTQIRSINIFIVCTSFICFWDLNI